MPGLLDRDGAAIGSRREPCQQLVLTETHGRDRGRDRRRQERTGKRQSAELFLEDHQIDEPEAKAACALGYEHTEPPEIGHRRPELGRYPDRVLDHLPHVGGRRLGGERRRDCPPEVLLLLGEGEFHRVALNRSRRQLTRSMTVAFACPPPSHIVWNP